MKKLIISLLLLIVAGCSKTDGGFGTKQPVNPQVTQSTAPLVAPPLASDQNEAMSQQISALIKKEEDADGHCKMMDLNDAETKVACERRETLWKELEAKGLCFSQDEQEWRKCSPQTAKAEADNRQVNAAQKNASASIPLEPAISQNNHIVAPPGVPPIPPSAAKSLSSTASVHCHVPDDAGNTFALYMSPQDCDEWIKGAKKLSKARKPALVLSGGVTLEQLNCHYTLTIYSQAQNLRDSGADPQLAYKALVHYHGSAPIITDEFIKNAINKIYFDASFSGSYSREYFIQEGMKCDRPAPKWKPLE